METLPAEGRVAGSQFIHNGMGYALSGDGDDHNSMETGELWQYNPESDSWSAWPEHPGMSRWAPASFVLHDEAYLINGMSLDPGSFDYMSTNWKLAMQPDVCIRCSLDGLHRAKLHLQWRSCTDHGTIDQLGSGYPFCRGCAGLDDSDAHR